LLKLISSRYQDTKNKKSTIVSLLTFQKMRKNITNPNYLLQKGADSWEVGSPFQEKAKLVVVIEY
jgi:hypothetical protein